MIFQRSSPSRLVPTVMNYYKATPPSIPPKTNNLMVYNFLTHLSIHLPSSHHLNLCLNKTEHKLLIQQSIFIYTFSQNFSEDFPIVYILDSILWFCPEALSNLLGTQLLTCSKASSCSLTAATHSYGHTLSPITAPSPKSLFQAF